MGFDLLDRVSLVDIADKNFSEQILSSCRDELWNGVVASQDFFIQHRFAVFVKRKEAAEHGVEGDAAAPDIHSDGIVEFSVDDLVSLDYFRSGVAGRPARSFQFFIVVIKIAESKIYQF